jgi:hypothetical protein
MAPGLAASHHSGCSAHPRGSSADHLKTESPPQAQDAAPLVQPAKPAERQPSKRQKRKLAQKHSRGSLNIEALIANTKGSKNATKRVQSDGALMTPFMHEDSLEAIVRALHTATEVADKPAMDTAAPDNWPQTSSEAIPGCDAMTRENLRYYAVQPFSLAEKIFRWAKITDFFNPVPPSAAADPSETMAELGAGPMHWHGSTQGHPIGYPPPSPRIRTAPANPFFPDRDSENRPADCLTALCELPAPPQRALEALGLRQGRKTKV